MNPPGIISLTNAELGKWGAPHHLVGNDEAFTETRWSNQYESWTLNPLVDGLIYPSEPSWDPLYACNENWVFEIFFAK